MEAAAVVDATEGAAGVSTTSPCCLLKDISVAVTGRFQEGVTELTIRLRAGAMFSS